MQKISLLLRLRQINAELSLTACASMCKNCMRIPCKIASQLHIPKDAQLHIPKDVLHEDVHVQELHEDIDLCKMA